MKRFVSFLISSNTPCAPVSVVYRLAERLTSSNCIVIIYTLRRPDLSNLPSKGIRIRPLTLRSLNAIFSGHVLHCNGFFPDIVGAFVFIFNFGKLRVLSTVHANIDLDLKDRYPRLISRCCAWLWRTSLEYRHAVAYLNRYHLGLAHASTSSIKRVIPNSVPPPCTTALLRPFDSRYQDILLYVGAIRPNKGIEDLIHLMPCLPNYSIHLFGSGSDGYTRKLVALSKQLRCEDRVIFKGVTNDVFNIYGRYRLLLVPSLTEGFCFVVVEAVASGLNVICRQIPEFEELYPFPPVYLHDFSSRALLASLIQSLMISPPVDVFNVYAQMYSPDKQLNAYLELYSSL